MLLHTLSYTYTYCKTCVSFYFLNNITTSVISVFGVALNENGKLSRVNIFRHLKKVRTKGKKTRGETTRDRAIFSVMQFVV